MIIKNGVDILEIARIQGAIDRFGKKFLDRIFTDAEIAECHGKTEAFAVRFAAKEAVTKALGTGIGPVTWKEVETLSKRSGEPYIILHGKAKIIADYLKLSDWAVSLSHSHENAVAMVVAFGK